MVQCEIPLVPPAKEVKVGRKGWICLPVDEKLNVPALHLSHLRDAVICCSHLSVPISHARQREWNTWCSGFQRTRGEILICSENTV